MRDAIALMLVVSAAAILVAFLLLALLARRVARAACSGLAGASEMVRARTRDELRRRVGEHDLERVLAGAFRGVGPRIVALAESRGIDILEAKRIFFERTVRLATLLDSAFRVGPVRIGLDPMLGLLPGVGDLFAKALSILVIVNGLQLGIPSRLVVRMVGNSAFDLVVGLVPVLGDVVDVFYRANDRNVALLRRHLEQHPVPHRIQPPEAICEPRARDDDAAPSVENT